jgi:hypothetical protein
LVGEVCEVCEEGFFGIECHSGSSLAVSINPASAPSSLHEVPAVPEGR